MKVLVLGIDGMIGHKIAQSIQNNYELFGTSRKDLKIQDIGLHQGKIVKHDFLKNNLENLLKDVSPSVIINCVGITPRRGINESIINSADIVAFQWEGYDLDGDIDNYDLIIENTSNGEEIKYEKIVSQNFEVELQIGNIYSWKITTRDKENNLSSSVNSTFELAN